MQFNTALGFFICALSLLCLQLDLQILSRLLSVIVLALGIATLSQYVFETTLGIDQLFMDHTIMTKTSHPGRMAPNTALCFSLCSLALLIGGLKRSLMISLCGAALILGAMALLGYIFKAEGVYGWGNLTRMAVHTAFGFVILTSGSIAYALSVKKNRRFDFWRLAPFSIATTVFILTLLSWYAVKEETQARNEAYFKDLTQETSDAILDRYALYEESLRGGLGLHYASIEVSRSEWKAYVNALNIEQTLPGINGLGYIDYTLAKNLEEYIESARADEAPDFQNHPQTLYPDKFIIKYIEPEEMNKEAIGLDIGFEPNRRAAAERARDLGVAALTKKILLVQDHEKKAGFLLLIPTYKTKNTPQTIEERREHFQGWVYAPFIGPKFLEQLSKVSREQLNFAVYDGETIVPETLIYKNAAIDMQGPYSIQTKIKIAGRTWTLQYSSSEDFQPPAKENTATLILLIGSIFSILLYATLWRLLHSKELIADQVEKRTAQLAESEQRFRATMEGSAVGMALVAPDGRWLKINNAMSDILGYSEEELKSLDFQSITYNCDLEADLDFVQKVLYGDLKTYQIEKRYIRKDGSIIWGLLSVALVREADGSPKHFISQIQDITTQKEAAEKILKANEELERSNLELERFAYIASHDLQEPLRKIGGFTDRLKAHLEGQLDDKALTYMNFVTDGAERMRELIQGLLAYSRIRYDKGESEKLDANEIVARAIDNLSETIAENEAKIQYDNLPTVSYSKVMMTQLFQNLISNAIKYRSKKNPEIIISAHKVSDFWEFSVADNGMGIEEQNLDRIFEMFQRLHRKEEIPGAGIGLSLCQKIVESYGGEIWVKSEHGKGSVFTFSVPI